MKVIETTATLIENGQLTLDEPLSLPYRSRVRVIVLIPDNKETDDDPIETIVEGLHEGWQQAITGKTRPISHLWVSL